MNRLFTTFVVGAMVLGVLTGWAVHEWASPAQAKVVAENLSIVTDVFLRLIKMIIAPLVFSTLVAGIAHMEDSASIGRVGIKALGWFIAASIVSLTIGLVMVHLLQPGSGLSLPMRVLQDNEQGRVELHRKPLGVVGSITPWNYPVAIAIWHVVPALRTGNTVVMKPSPYTPLTTLRMVELLNEVLPPGGTGS